jgi:UDP-3-O-acyl-N-acetylglucosamine deacetylase
MPARTLHSVRRCFTLASRCDVSGVGLHSGVTASVRLMPAAAADGIHFVRTDLPGRTDNQRQALHR